MKKILLLLSFLLIGISAYSQMLNNLELGTPKKYTKTEIIQAFGMPDKIYPSLEEFGLYSGIFEWGKSKIMVDDGELSSFIVFDSRFIVMPDIITGGLKVGDVLTQENFNKLKIELVGGKDYMIENGIESFVKGDWNNGFYYQLGDWAYFSIGIDKNHVITSMSFQMRD